MKTVCSDGRVTASSPVRSEEGSAAADIICRISARLKVLV